MKKPRYGIERLLLTTAMAAALGGWAVLVQLGGPETQNYAVFEPLPGLSDSTDDSNP